MRILIESLGLPSAFPQLVEALANDPTWELVVREAGSAFVHAGDGVDLVLLLSVLGGDTTLGFVEKNGACLRSVPCIVIDAQFSPAVHAAMLAAGATEYLDYAALDPQALGFAIKLATRMQGSIHRARREQAKFEALRDTLDVGTWEWDLRKNSFEWSAREYDLFGIAPGPDKLAYKSWRDAIDPQDRERIEAELGRAIVGQADYHAVFRINKHSATGVPELHWIEGVGRVERDDHGAALRMYGLNWDVTAKYQALADLEARRDCTNCLSHQSKNTFQTYFEQSVDCLFHIVETSDGRLLYTAMNPSGLKHAGQALDKILGRTPSEVLGKEVGGAIEAGIHLAIRNGKPFSYKPTFDMGEGSVIYDAIYIPITNKYNQNVGVLGCARDITAEKRMEASLVRAQKMEALGHIAGGTAHDFNNVLQNISSSLDIFEYIKTPGRREEAIKICRVAVKCGQALTSGLLAFARREELILRAADLNELISGIHEMVRLTLGARIELQVEATPDLWSVLISEQQIELAIINLVVNARDAMPDGGTVRITTANKTVTAPELQLDPGDYVCLSVADTGAGMPAPVLARATEPFFTTKSAGKGTGLGLSMVGSTATGLGGAIHIASEPGKGTVVSLYLKRAAARPLPSSARDGA